MFAGSVTGTSVNTYVNVTGMAPKGDAYVPVPTAVILPVPIVSAMLASVAAPDTIGGGGSIAETAAGENVNVPAARTRNVSVGDAFRNCGPDRNLVPTAESRLNANSPGAEMAVKIARSFPTVTCCRKLKKSPTPWLERSNANACRPFALLLDANLSTTATFASSGSHSPTSAHRRLVHPD